MTPELLAAIAAALAAAGVYLIYTSVVFGWRGFGPSSRRSSHRSPVDHWLRQSGLEGARPAELVAAVVVVSGAGAAVAFVIFGGLLPALIAGLVCCGVPVASLRARRTARMEAAREAWPRLLEELRLLIGSMGRSVPQGLFEAGRRGPEEWRPAFAAAEREWLLTTDFPRTAAILKHRLADPTADVVCETLLVAHELGGSDIDGRLADLIDDRVLDLQGRKDAASRQAGVRFARRFVLLVPLGMALAGLAIGTGRSAYETTGGQIAVAIGLLAVVACWMWSGRLMRLPQEPRVFR
jgi:tight adherence protein B